MTAAFDVFVATLATLGFNVVLGLALAGVGLQVRRSFGIQTRSVESDLQAFWLGFSVVQTFLVIWNFFYAIRPAVFAGVLVAGSIGLWLSRRDRAEAQPRLPRWCRILSVLFCIWVANLSLAPMTYWDSALYHMQGVRWATEYAAVPGLANLFGPLGFNSVAWLYDAMVNVGPWSGASWHVSNGLLVSVLGAQVILAAGRFASLPSPAHVRHLFPLLLMPVVINSALDGRASSYATVVPASLLVIAASLALFRALMNAEADDRTRAFDLFTTAAITSVAVAVKSSAAIFAAATVAVCFWILVRRVTDRAMRRRVITWSAAAIVIVGLSWAARGVVLSGYPLFPSPTIAAPVDWRVPEDHARAEFDFVRHSALATAENFPFVSGEVSGIQIWFRHWARSALYDLYDMAVPGLLGLVITGTLLTRFRRADSERRAAAAALAPMLVPTVAASIAWWIVAPMPHYGSAFFWLGLATLGTQAHLLKSVAASRRSVLVIGLALGFSPVVMSPVWSVLQAPRGRTIVTGVAEANFKQPDAGRLFASTPAPQNLESFTTNSGLVLSVPTGRFGRCWYAPLPCTPNPAPNLRLRDPGRLDRGFTVDDDWQMIGWPEPWRHELLPAMRARWRKND